MKITDTRIVEENLFRFLIQLEIMRAIRYQNYVTLLLMEPDQGVEDNSKLTDLAEILHEEIRGTDIIGRLDRTRFGAILLHADLKSAYLASARIHSRTKDYFSGNNNGFTISIGGACCPSNSTDSGGLSMLAESMLAIAREKGGNSISFPNGKESA